MSLTGYIRENSVDDCDLTSRGTIRQKTWAPRSRTGCRTCRLRRIKCDEGKPVCLHCKKSQRTCLGYDLPCRDGDVVFSILRRAEDLNPEHVVATRRQTQRRPNSNSLPRKHDVSTDLEPPQWELMETLRYYYAAIRPRLANNVKPFQDPQPHHIAFDPLAFTCLIICHNIKLKKAESEGSLQSGRNLRLVGPWGAFHQHITRFLSIINQQIAQGSTLALRGIWFLWEIDLELHLMSWRAHINGYLALVQHLGGVDTVFSVKNPPRGSFCFILTHGIASNTTSPAKQQIPGIDLFSDGEIRLIYAWEVDEPFPCPIDLLLSIVHITRLRVYLATNTGSSPLVPQMTRDLLVDVSSFDPLNWVEKGRYDKKNIVVAITHAFQVAAALYGILTLPPSAVGAWAAATGHLCLPGESMYESVRKVHRAELLRIIRQNWSTVLHPICFTWPLAVAGVAVVDAAQQDRDFVAACLFNIWKLDDGGAAPFLCREKLLAFWTSGKTGWEECYDEPTPS